jgi:hypothetical protein
LAIQIVEVEKARRKAENDARLQTLAQQQEHEARLLALSQDRSKKKLLVFALGSVVLAAILAIAGSFYVNETRRLAEVERVRFEEETLRLRAEDQRAIDELEQRLGRLGAEDEARRGVLEDELGKLRQQATQLPHSKTERAPGKVVPKPPKPPKTTPKKDVCMPGDPMCDTLGH